MADSEWLRVRNLSWLMLRQIHGASCPVIAAYAGVSERTVRRGIADARTYRPGRNGTGGVA